MIPDFPPLRIASLSLLLLISGSFAAAQPFQSDYYFLMREGNQHFEKGDFEKARDSWRAAVLLEPEDPRARHNLGLVLAKLKEYAEAESTFDKIQKNTTDPTIRAEQLYQRGQIYSEQAIAKEQEQELQPALENALKALEYFREAEASYTDVTPKAQINREETSRQIKRIVEQLQQQQMQQNQQPSQKNSEDQGSGSSSSNGEPQEPNQENQEAQEGDAENQGTGEMTAQNPTPEESEQGEQEPEVAEAQPQEGEPQNQEKAVGVGAGTEEGMEATMTSEQARSLLQMLGPIKTLTLNAPKYDEKLRKGPDW
jgi:tetratricopeptide (TPR) repeat protein